MRRYVSKTAMMLALALMTAPLQAKWTEMVAGNRVAVANSKLTVIAAPRWNQSSARPTKKSENWSFDGPLLNEIDFFGGVTPGEPLFKELDKKRNPLPKFVANMQASEVAEMYERTSRIAVGASDFVVDTVIPAKFAGHAGFKFTYHFTQGEALGRKGIASGAIIDGKLYLISFTAPALYYYDARLADAQSMMDSATLG